MADTAETVYRDYVTDGVPASGNNDPNKAAIRRLLKQYEAVITAFLSNGGLIYTSKAQIDSDLLHGPKSSAWVIGDAIVANNGIYQKQGSSGAGSWTRVADLPYSFIIAADIGAGTPNAIQATTSIPVSGSALVWMNVFEANTGSPVTVQFNGGSALTVKAFDNADIMPGGLTAGMIIGGFASGSAFRMISDQSRQALNAALQQAVVDAEEARDLSQNAAQSSAEARDASQVARQQALEARDAAQVAASNAEAAADTAANDVRLELMDIRDETAGYASDAVSQGSVPVYSSAVSVASLTVPDLITFIRTNGYHLPNGTGAALYRLKNIIETDEPGQILSNAGAKRWGLALDSVGPEQCGAKGDYDAVAKTGTDDTIAVTTAFRFADYARVPLIVTRAHKLSLFDYGTVSGIDRDTNGNRYALFLKGMGAITVIGRGGSFWFSGTNRNDYAYMIHSEDSETISIYGDLTFDWVDLPYIQGTVTAVDANYVEALLEWAPSFTDVQRVNKWSKTDRINIKTLRDRPSGLYDAGSALNQQSGLTYRILRSTGTWDVTGLAVGDLITADHQIYMNGAISSFRTKNIYIGPGVKIRHCAGIAVWLRSGRRAIVEGVEINTAPDSFSLLSSSADGVHISGFKESSIKDSRIYRTGDDCINQNTYLTPVTARASDRVFTLQYSFPYVNPTVGDRIRLYRTTTGVTLDVRVVSFVDPGVPDTNTSTFGAGYSMTVDTDTDASLADGTWKAVFIDAGMIEDVSGNRIGFNRGRGVLTSKSVAFIKDNHIEKTGAGIICGTYSTEFGKTDLLVIEDNVLVECNYPSISGVDLAAIIVQGQIVGTSTIAAVLGTISVAKNTIIRTKSTGILVRGAVTALISDNDLFDVATTPANPSVFGSDAMAIAVDTVTNAYVGGNRNMQGAAVGLGIAEVTNLRVGANDNIVMPNVANVVTGGFNSLRPVSDPASVNFFEVQGGVTGYGPVIRAAGTDTNIPAILSGKGTGGAQFWANSCLAFEGYNSGPTSVNWVRAQGQIAGYEVSVSAQGADTNIDLAWIPKGTGKNMFGTWDSNADANVNGFITIKDSAGNLRKLATIA